MFSGRADRERLLQEWGNGDGGPIGRGRESEEMCTLRDKASGIYG